jgi:D-xylose transport system permease protein
MTTVDVAAPDLGPQDADERESLWQRALGNVRSGNLGVLPVVLGEVLIVTYFGFTATNFFTAGNFVNVILQMAGVTMIAYGVVFVLLLGEIDLSIGYLSGIAAVTVAELQLPDGRNWPGYLAILGGIAVVAVIGTAQGTVVAKIGVPSFVVTLAGLLIWQGVILKILELRGVIIIESNWINYAATYYFSANVGWLIAAVITGLYALAEVAGAISQRRAGLSPSPWIPIAKLVGVAVACFGTVAVCNHAARPAACPPGTPLTVNCTQSQGLPLAALLMLIFLVGLTFLAKRTTFGRHVYAVGGNAEAARCRGRRPRRAAPVGQPAARRRDTAPRLDLGRGHRRRQPVRRTRRGPRGAPRLARDRDGRERPEHRRLLDGRDLHRHGRHPAARGDARLGRQAAAGTLRSLIRTRSSRLRRSGRLGRSGGS